MEKLFDWVVNHESISMLCCPNFNLVHMIRKLGIEIDNINYDLNFTGMPNLINKDIIFDNVKLKECVVHYNCEKTYPVGKIHKGIFILRGDDKGDNGDCKPIKSIEQIIEENEISTIYETYVTKNKNKHYNHYYVYGSNI